jgi:hypothetical protein
MWRLFVGFHKAGRVERSAVAERTVAKRFDSDRCVKFAKLASDCVQPAVEIDLFVFGF